MINKIFQISTVILLAVIMCGMVLTPLSFFTANVQAATSIRPLADISVGCTSSDLINAITTANNTPAADIIVLSSNCVYTLYQPIQTLAGTPEITTTFGKTGLPAITTTIIISGHGATIQRTLTATNDFSGSFRLMTVGQDGDLTLYDLTLKNGLAQGGDSKQGGGAAGMGGAIFNNRGHLALERVTLLDNVAQGGSGGNVEGVVLGGGGVGEGGIGTFIGGGPNSNGGFGGGGTNGNAGGFGGGGGASAGGFGGGGGGGGGDNIGGFGAGNGESGGNFIGGGGVGFGGAVFNLTGTLRITNSTFYSNSAQGGEGYQGGSAFGGAIFNLNGPAVIINSTLSDNSVLSATGAISSPAGGGIFSLGDGGLDSTSAGGNDLAASATLILSNTIVANTANGAVDCQVDTFNAGTSNVTGITNLIEQNSACAGVTVTSDPSLGPLQNNGGNSSTMALLSGSLAIDAGTNSAIIGVSTDQRGFSRIISNTVDIGAYELTLDADVGVNKSVTPTSVKEQKTITYTIVVTNAGPFAATGLIISDTLPVSVTFVASNTTSGSGNYDPGSGLWNIGTLTVNGRVTLTIVTTVNTGTIKQNILNTAAVNAVDQSDLVTGNNSSSASVTVISGYVYLPLIIK